MVSSMAFRMKALPSLACFSALARMSTDRPLALLSIWSAVMPSEVPQTLKSMSPRKSSRPWMSVRMTTSSPSLMSPMATPETGADIGTPASMRASVDPQVDAIEDDPLDSRYLGYHADCVREVVLAGKHRDDGALGKCAVADLAALGGAHAPGLAGAVGREVVLVHVALALFGPDGVKALPLVEHAQRADGKRLRLAALEQARAVHAGQVAGNDVQRPDLGGGSAVHALACLDDHLAHGSLLERLQLGGDVGPPDAALLVGEVVLLDGVLKLLDLGDARELVRVLEGGFHLVVVRRHAVDDGLLGNVDDVLHGSRVRLGHELCLLVAECADGLLGELHRGKHVLLRDAVGTRLDHRDVVLGAGDGQFEVGIGLLGHGGVDDELPGVAVATDADAGRRAVERGAPHHEGRACAGDAYGVGLVLAVDDERGADDVHLVLVSVGEPWADGAVDHARGQRAMVGGLGLALEVAPGILPTEYIFSMKSTVSGKKS